MFAPPARRPSAADKLHALESAELELQSAIDYLHGAAEPALALQAQSVRDAVLADIATQRDIVRGCEVCQ